MFLEVVGLALLLSLVQLALRDVGMFLVQLLDPFPDAVLELNLDPELDPIVELEDTPSLLLSRTQLSIGR